MFHIERLDIYREFERVRSALQATMPANPLLHGWSSYSQCDEDGIIRYCLEQIGKQSELSKTFVELGCADGLENNTHQLLLDGYRGVWCEGSSEKIAFIKGQLGGLSFSALKIMETFVSTENIGQLMAEAREFLEVVDLDFLTVDLDGNDLHLMDGMLKVFSPKLICVEYNAKFVPPTRLVMRNDVNHGWAGDDFYGASLQSWVDELTQYSLVCCNASGANAFFVDNKYAHLFEIYPLERLYQPPRYWLANGSLGHVNSMKWLAQRLNT